MTALLERTAPTRIAPAGAGPGPTGQQAFREHPARPKRTTPRGRVTGPDRGRPLGSIAAVRRPGRTAVRCATLPGAEPGRACPALMAPAAALWLTRRARLLITMSVLVGLAVVIGVSALNAGAAPGGLREAPATVVVQPGDTLWGIATDLAPAERPERVVRLLRTANGLASGVLQPGQELVVPRG